MTDSSARFALPHILAGQAQKELYHNEALALIDGLLHPAAVAIGDDLAPADPAPGDCWIVGTVPTGDWVGEAGKLAIWTAGGWRFSQPRAGMQVWLVESDAYAQWNGSAWVTGRLSGTAVEIAGQQVVGPRESAIGDVIGGSVIDDRARAAIAAILAALRSHGLIDT
jgi:hypothetical protein